ncbi:MAG: autotransporter domain-containing protein [Proteobacteria bacterium]|nr:autotransporter domain-containing protein [Pseudomonadota bacterium]
MKNAKKPTRLTTLLKISLLSCAVGLHSGTTEAAPPIYISSFGGPGAGNGQFNSPQAIAIDPTTRNLYIVDSFNNRVQVFDTLGTYQSQFGTPGAGNGQFGSPVGASFGAGGNLYVVDSNNGRVQTFDSLGNYLSQFGSFGVGPGQFLGPTGMDIDSGGNVYVADSNNSRVQALTSAGVFISQFGVGTLTTPRGVLVTGAGTRYVTDFAPAQNNVRIFDSTGALTGTFGGTGPGNGQFVSPQGIDQGQQGVYVVDAGNNRVQIFNAAGGYLSQFATQGATPNEITIEPTTGKIYISSTVANNVEEWFDPAEWTLPGTSKLMQLPLNQALTLNNGFNLQVQNALSLFAGGDVTINPGGTLSANSIVLNGGSITDTASTTLTMPMTLTTGTLIGNSPLTSANLFIYQGDISGGPGATLNIGGIGVVLTGNNTFTGNINILPGTALFGNAASFNNNPINNPLATPGGVGFLQTTDATYAGSITGGGNLAKIGAGNLTLTNAANAFNTMFISQGTLTGNASSLNAATIFTAGSGKIVFDQVTNASFAGQFGGSGPFEKKGVGGLTLTNALNSLGSITITQGILQGNAASLNTSSIINNSDLRFDQVTDATFAGAITGPGTFQKLGAGRLTLSNQGNNIGGGITHNAGVLIGDTGSLNTPTIANNAALVFNQGTAGTFAGAITGAGTFQKIGTDALRLTNAANTFSAITVTQGTLIGNAASLNAPVINNTVSAILTFDQVTDATFGGLIASAAGAFNKVGAGNLTLTNPANVIAIIGNFGGTLTGNAASLNAGAIGTLAPAKTVFDQTTNASFGGQFGGSGAFEKKGAGTLTLTNALNSFGSITITQGGLVGNAASLNTTSIINNSNLRFNQATDATFAGAITGGGFFEKQGAGNLRLTNAGNNFNFILNGTGTLTGNAKSLNSATGINNSPGAHLVFNQTTNDTYASSINSQGTFQKIGAGNLTLTNAANAFNGGITVTQGTLTGNVASLNTPTIVNNAVLAFNQTTDASFGGAITGTGTFRKFGAGNLTLTNPANTFGQIQNFVGTLTGNTSTLNAAGFLNTGTLVFNQITDGTYGGLISGGGTFVKQGAGNLTLTNAMTSGAGAPPPTIINNQGTLTVTPSNLLNVNIQNNATLVFNQIPNGTFGGQIGGAGNLIKTGPGILTMTGNFANFAGTTTIAQGELAFTQTTPNKIAVSPNAALDFNLAPGQSVTYGGSITGAGNVKVNAPGGKLTMTGTQPYDGTTSVNQGTFALNGSLPNSEVFVAQGATIMGNGNMNSLAVNGIVAPGNSIGKITVATTFTMTPTATYQAEIDGSGATDLIAVGGAASLAGTLQVSGTNLSQFKNQTFTILTANGGVGGAFANLTSLSRLKYTVQYLANAVNITINNLQDFGDAFGPTNTSNAARTARYFDTFANSTVPGSDLEGIIKLLDGLLDVGDVAGTKHAFSQIQPSQYRELGMLSFTNNELVSRTVQSQQQYLRETHRVEVELKELEGVPLKRAASFRQLVNDTLSKGFNFANASSPSGLRKASLGFMAPHGTEGSGMPGSQRIRFGDSSTWFQSYGQIHEKNSSHGNVGLRSQTGGLSIGGDHQIVKNVFVGLFGGMSTTPFNWKHSRGHGRMKSYYGGVYGTWMSDMGLYVDGQVIAGQDRFHSTRKIQFANINRRAKEGHHGNQFSVDTEIGYAWGLPMMTVQPYIDASYMVVHEHGFREKGAQSLNFRIKSKTSPFIRGAVGTQLYRTFVCRDMLIRPAVQLAYVRKQPLGHKNVRGGLVGQPQTLSVVGDNKVRNQFAPGVSLTAQLENGTYIIGNVSGQVFSGENSGEALVRIGYDF